MIYKRLFLPTGAHLEALQELPLTKCKTLGESRAAWLAASYAIHRAHLGRHAYGQEFVPLWSQLVGMMAGSGARWKAVKERLLAADVLRCDGISRVGAKSLGFALGEALSGCKWQLGERVALPFPEPEKAFPGLALDLDEAEAILRRLMPVNGHWREMDFEYWLARCREFSPAYFTGRTGRVFGDANQIPTPVRSALRINGKRTLELDIKNSNPCFLVTVYPAASKERVRYKALAESGELYEVFAERLGTDRALAKDRFLKVIYGNREETAEIRPVFTELFPELAAIIEETAKRHFKALVFDIQRKEAGVILDACAKFGGASIHDGMRVEEDLAPAARAYLRAIIKERHGFEPRITVEN